MEPTFSCAIYLLIISFLLRFVSYILVNNKIRRQTAYQESQSPKKEKKKRQKQNKKRPLLLMRFIYFGFPSFISRDNTLLVCRMLFIIVSLSYKFLNECFVLYCYNWNNGCFFHCHCMH